ncbi:hypothetical protein Q1695_011367 [Nippostrongylus brasiliensis]|nr:hypothetical protein Q1695_011367 [Nippostrongylus brasiliensis]
MTLKKNKGPKNPWGPDMQEIKFKTENIGKTLNVKIYVDGRYEPPLDLPRQPTKSNDTLEVKTAHSKQTDTFYFLVKRKSSQKAIFDTSIGGLIFSDKFLQIATYLPSNALYGFGENSHQSLQHDFSRYTTWGMFARDEHPHYSALNTNNLYGVHPFYMIMEPDGCAHGVFIHNTNAQEITTAPGPALIYRTIGGNIDLFFFPGPTPEEVIQQYLALIGKPVMPAYWALGFQLSRWMYNDLFEMKRIVARNMQAGIPLETVVADIDYMDRYKDFTVGPKYEGLGEYVKQLHSWNMRSILIYDPAIQVDYGTFERGIKSNLYNLTKGTKIMLAVVWPDRHTAYPDFLDPTNATQKWWIDETVRFHKEVPSDGIWIDMNEPASFGTNEDNPWYYADLDHPDPKPLRCPTKGTDAVWDKPPYETYNVYNYGKSSTLAEKTVCMLGLQANGTQRVYNVKSIYGWSQAKATLPAQHAMTGKRGLVISRSTFASAGRYSGHWLGDNSATWLDLEASVIGAQEFNMFGMPYVGSDICGFNGDTTEELCLRWHQMGAFHPFMRNHNTKGSLPQDPARWTTVTKATIKATLFRYKYLPFLYSLHFAASMHGGTVIRPVFFEFPHDHATYNLGYQFMWGKSMLIAPVVKGGTKSVRVYLPNGAWYSLYDYNYGEWILSGWQEFPAPTTSLIPVFARGGSILPRQAPNTTTAVSRQNPFELLIAPSEKGTAKGFLYWDDGESIIHSYDTYKYCHWEFKYKVDKNGAALTIHTKRSCDVNVDRSSYDEVKNILHIHSKNLINLSAGGTIDLSWKHSKTDDTKTIHHGGTLTQHIVTPRQKPPADLEANDLRSTITVKDLPQGTGTQMDPNDVRPTTTINDLPQGTGTQMAPNDVRKNEFAYLFTVIGLACGFEVRMECHPEPHCTKAKCEKRGCIWSEPYGREKSAPWCYLKPGIGYVKKKESGTSITLKKNNGPKHPWGKDIDEIQFKSSTIGKTLNVKIGVDGRYEPPVDFPRHPSKSSDALEAGGLIFSDKFLQIATFLPTDEMYGWGESSHQTLKHDFAVYTTWALLARDEPPKYSYLATKNLYGVHPFYMMLEPDGKSHGVLILNSNAQEVTTTPGPALIYRTIGGNLDLYFFPGPSPTEVIQQYMDLIGKPALPAYWSLGYQLSRYYYDNLDEMKRVIARNVEAGVQVEVVVADIDYMDRCKDFTVSKKFEGLGDYTKELREKGMRVILMYDPAIQVDYDVFERAIKSGARFVEWEKKSQVPHRIQGRYPLVKDTKIMLGVVWPDRHTAFPDFMDPTNATQKWWIDEIVRFYKKVPSDGIWIDMNEPANFGTNEDHPWYFNDTDHPNIEPLWCPTSGEEAQWDVPPYQTHSVHVYDKKPYLASKTLCMLALQANGTQRFYNTKNLYGLMEAKWTKEAQHAMTGKRGVLVSRSTFPSAGRWTGHWLGDNAATWEDLRASVIGAQEFNMFGIPYIGADICGFHEDTTEELCLRWQQLGAFHPFMRNHNTKGAVPQDPARWISVAKITIKTTGFRLKYLPFLYSLHFAASMHGETVIRPVFFEFPHDVETHNLGYQFLWGRSMLIAPVLYEAALKVEVYLPDDDWYSLFDDEYGTLIQPGYQKFDAPWTWLIPIFARGGSILPRQGEAMTTTESRKKPFELLIAPSVSDNSASGFMYWDDGEVIVDSFDKHNYYHWTFKYTADDYGASLSIKMEHRAVSRLVEYL